MNAADTLRTDLESAFAALREAIRAHDVPAMRRLMNAPPDAPAPPRSQMSAFLDMLPDLAKSRFLKIVRRGDDAAAYYALTDLERDDQLTVTVVHFARGSGGWTLARGNSIQSVAHPKNEISDPERLIASEPRLAPQVPEGPVHESPPSTDEDPRSDDEVRRDLERVWTALDAARSKGDGAVAPLLHAPPGKTLAPAHIRALTSRVPALSRTRFLRLGWNREKPEAVAYYTQTHLDDRSASTVLLVFFARRNGEWKFAVGAVETVRLAKADRAALLEAIDRDPRLKW
jgi:hypothetical protein